MSGLILGITYMCIYADSRFGCEVMISDQGTEFVNKVKEALFELTGTRHRVTSAYDPQTNGLTERFNQTLQTSLLKISITPSYLMASRYQRVR